MQSELKPCPFCGGADVRLRHHQANQMSWVSCVGCGLEAPSETGVTDDDAVAYWNRRAECAQSEWSRVSDKMVEKAANAIAEKRGYVWTGTFDAEEIDIGRENMRAALEAALSAAEPQPAPSVAVKSLEWKSSSHVGWEWAESSVGEYQAHGGFDNSDCFSAAYRIPNESEWKRADNLEKAKEAAQLDFNKRVRAALCVDDRNTWLPIKNAPKDGTSILAVEDFEYEWEDEAGQLKTRPGDWAVVSWHPQHEEWIGFGMILSSFTPTHWVPLPASPSSAEDDDANR